MDIVTKSFKKKNQQMEAKWWIKTDTEHFQKLAQQWSLKIRDHFKETDKQIKTRLILQRS